MKHIKQNIVKNKKCVAYWHCSYHESVLYVVISNVSTILCIAMGTNTYDLFLTIHWVSLQYVPVQHVRIKYSFLCMHRRYYSYFRKFTSTKIAITRFLWSVNKYGTSLTREKSNQTWYTDNGGHISDALFTPWFTNGGLAQSGIGSAETHDWFRIYCHVISYEETVNSLNILEMVFMALISYR